MDHFESIMCTLLEAQGYWVRRSFKVNLSATDKADLKKTKAPRPEIDILALKPGTNKILALEVKSYLDSAGVKPEYLEAEYAEPQGRYKMFTCTKYRDLVFRQLLQDLVDLGMATPDYEIVLGLATGKIHKNRTDDMDRIMKARQWCFWSPERIKEEVGELAGSKYANDQVTLTAKILMR